MARRTSRLVPVGEIGLMPTPESQRICFLPSFSMSLFRNSRSFFASGEPDFHSMPIYTSSVFSRKIKTFSFSGWRTGEGGGDDVDGAWEHFPVADVGLGGGGDE